MKKLILILIFLLLAMPTAVKADDVGVVADPVYGTPEPYNFTLTIVGENQILAEWDADPAGDENFELRRSVETYPTTQSEGEQVYLGSEKEFLDTGADIGLEIDKYTYYYSLWGYEGTWSEDYTSADTGGTMTNMILLGILVFLGFGLAIGGYALHRSSLAFASAGVWFITAVWGYIDAASEWGISMGIFWIAIAMFFTTAIESVTLSRGTEKAEDELEYQEAKKEAIDESMADMDEDISFRRQKRRENR